MRALFALLENLYSLFDLCDVHNFEKCDVCCKAFSLCVYCGKTSSSTSLFVETRGHVSCHDCIEFHCYKEIRSYFSMEVLSTFLVTCFF